MTIHWTMQGKGGVGKSVISALIAQNRRAVGIDTVCVDCDPVNTTLARFEGLEATALDLMDAEGEVNPRAFDELVERIMALPAGSDMVIDTGATIFVPLSRYIVQNELPAVLEQLGHEMAVHVVVPGGPALGDSLVGLEAILRSIDGARIVVWLNGFFGPFIGLDGEPLELEDIPIYQEHRDRVESVVELREEPALFAADFRAMLSRKHVFAEVADDGSYSFMSRQRLRLLCERLMDQISQALGVPPAAAVPEEGKAAAKA